MAGAKHARLFRKRFDDSLDGLVLVDSVVLVPDVEVVTTHESDPQHYLHHAHAPTSGSRRVSRGRLPLASKIRSVAAEQPQDSADVFHSLNYVRNGPSVANDAHVLPAHVH